LELVEKVFFFLEKLASFPPLAEFSPVFFFRVGGVLGIPPVAGMLFFLLN